MKPTIFSIPTPQDINENPEIALLYLLSEFLAVASRTLIAAHPILLNDDRPPWVNLSPDDEEAKLLLTSLDRLSQSILRYKKTVTPPPSLNKDPIIDNY